MSKKNPFLKPEANQSPGFLFWQVSVIWQRQVAAALRPLEITQTQFVLLASLLWLSKKESHVSQAVLARHSKMDVMTTSQVLRTLEEKDYIKREPHPEDTRAKVLKLTKKGEARARQAVPLVEGVDEEFFNSLGSGRSKIIQLLQELIQSNENGGK